MAVGVLFGYGEDKRLLRAPASIKDVGKHGGAYASMRAQHPV